MNVPRQDVKSMILKNFFNTTSNLGSLGNPTLSNAYYVLLHRNGQVAAQGKLESVNVASSIVVFYSYQSPLMDQNHLLMI